MLLDDDIQQLLEAKKKGKHRCLNGRYVDYFSKKCRDDIQRRIKDTLYARNNEECRSDSRSYYTGILRVLRRKLREVERQLYYSVDNKNNKKNIREYNENDSRILKLAGII